MSVAQTKAAARKMNKRYGDPKRRARTVAQSMEMERKKAARAASIKKK